MESRQVVILPGLDGTELLLAGFVKRAPAGFTATVLPLPDDPADDYESLCRSIALRLRDFAPCHLVAESFSGPLGILLAARHPELVDRLTLVASFADSPVPWVARWLPWRWIFRIPLPSIVVRHYFVGSDRSVAVELRHAIRQTSVATLAKRMRCLMDVDVRAELAVVRCPLRYIRPNNDRLVPARAVDRIRHANGNVTVVEVNGPHLILQTQPQQAWSAIVDGL